MLSAYRSSIERLDLLSRHRKQPRLQVPPLSAQVRPPSDRYAPTGDYLRHTVCHDALLVRKLKHLRSHGGSSEEVKAAEFFFGVAMATLGLISV